MEEKQLSRRAFFKYGILGVTTLSFAKLFNLNLINSASGADKKESCPGEAPKVDKKDILEFDGAMAKGLKFHTDAASIESKKTKMDAKQLADSGFSVFKTGSSCGNCTHYLDKDPKATKTWAPCRMTGNKMVPSCAWCKVWTKKA